MPKITRRGFLKGAAAVGGAAAALGIAGHLGRVWKSAKAEKAALRNADKNTTKLLDDSRRLFKPLVRQRGVAMFPDQEQYLRANEKTSKDFLDHILRATGVDPADSRRNAARINGWKKIANFADLPEDRRNTLYYDHDEMPEDIRREFSERLRVVENTDDLVRTYFTTSVARSVHEDALRQRYQNDPEMLWRKLHEFHSIYRGRISSAMKVMQGELYSTRRPFRNDNDLERSATRLLGQ